MDSDFPAFYGSNEPTPLRKRPHSRPDITPAHHFAAKSEFYVAAAFLDRKWAAFFKYFFNFFAEIVGVIFEQKIHFKHVVALFQ